jgi:predicted nuclease of restriction endonuclease-like (RecB) superfamily
LKWPLFGTAQSSTPTADPTNTVILALSCLSRIVGAAMKRSAKKKPSIPARSRKKPSRALVQVVKPKPQANSFAHLVRSIRELHEQCAAQVNRAVNVTLTLRNWAIGGYIHHYELHGSDRARYGEAMMEALSAELTKKGMTTAEPPRLYSYLSFFRAYPIIADVIPAEWHQAMPLTPQIEEGQIFRSVTGKSSKKAETQIFRSVTGKLEVSGKMLVERLSYTHLELLTPITDPLKRAFYEIECIRGSWPVRALRRQISTLYFERSGLSKNPEKLAAMVRSGIPPEEPALAIRDPYIFEFLGMKAREAEMTEDDLETALLDHLQEFMLELGEGFCLEARQKSIVIGRTRGFVDLVFYHRVLRCHVLMELKINDFTHESLGQLNSYVTWYRRHMMKPGDNPPIGLLLCTDRDRSVVEYAMAAMDNALFVSQYKLELPDAKKLQRFLMKTLRELEG